MRSRQTNAGRKHPKRAADEAPPHGKVPANRCVGPDARCPNLAGMGLPELGHGRRPTTPEPDLGLPLRSGPARPDSLFWPGQWCQWRRVCARTHALGGRSTLDAPQPPDSDPSARPHARPSMHGRIACLCALAEPTCARISCAESVPPPRYPLAINADKRGPRFTREPAGAGRRVPARSARVARKNPLPRSVPPPPHALCCERTPSVLAAVAWRAWCGRRIIRSCAIARSRARAPATASRPLLATGRPARLFGTFGRCAPLADTSPPRPTALLRDRLALPPVGRQLALDAANGGIVLQPPQLPAGDLALLQGLLVLLLGVFQGRSQACNALLETLEGPREANASGES